MTHVPASDQQAMPAVFLDRDGTLMHDVEYCGDPASVRVFPDAADALHRLKSRGFALIMATNQSGIGRGYFTEEDFQRVQDECLSQLGRGLFDACYHCPDAPDRASDRRKPAPGMLLEAAREHHLDLAASYMIGDSGADLGCGRNAGVSATIHVLTGKQKILPLGDEADFVAQNLREATDWILAREFTHHG